MKQIKNFFLNYLQKVKIPLLLSVLIVTFFIYVLFGSKYRLIYNVGDSMMPSIENHSLLVVEKKSSLGKNWKPDRYDIVVVQTQEEKLVKRIIGLPGDKIRIHQGEIYLNESPLLDLFHGKIKYYRVDENDKIIGTVYVSNKRETVPKGYVWVIGDNREESWFGLVPINQIVGLVVW